MTNKILVVEDEATNLQLLSFLSQSAERKVDRRRK